jgi:hypothetical protein
MSDVGGADFATAEPVSGNRTIAPKADRVRRRRARTIENDLKKRQLQNKQREQTMSLVERWVLDLKVDWAEFHERLDAELDGCDHTTTQAERILAEMGLHSEVIHICRLYFSEVGGGCDCEIALNVDMTNPRPRCDSRCHDCGNDYDEYYMVHDHVWKASGLPKDGGELCVDCLERRIGRRLRSDDFTDAPINRCGEHQSLRLQDRINGRGQP